MMRATRAVMRLARSCLRIQAKMDNQLPKYVIEQVVAPKIYGIPEVSERDLEVVLADQEVLAQVNALTQSQQLKSN